MKAQFSFRFIKSRNLLLAGLTALITSVLAQPVLPVFAADKSVDQRTYSDYTNNKYYLVFCARGGSSTGHAFVVWGIQDSGRGTSTYKAFGFYPSQGTGAFGQVPGQIRNEAFSGKMNKITDRLIVQVDKAVYDRTQRAISEWRTTNYDLFSTNCINFVMSVARDAGLRVPQRDSTTFPSDYVQALINAN
ncbi:MAG: hypothetical protein KME45_26155 [Stenomitos rutilans HA7619-LM2]|jgi:hypothetical protein|nr:hypothetical protein [Stenomitos rutilans HA7619-LM2]